MHKPDVGTFRAFYASSLGTMTRKRLAGHIKQFWPENRSENIAGVGYALPYLDQEAVAFLPGWCGPQAWPDGKENRTSLAPDSALPLREGTINRVLMVHGLEFSERPKMLLEEIWHALVPKGRALIIVPNRLGLWARMEKTPFGFGTPYSLMQLESLLKQTRFHVLRTGSALFMPPTESRLVLRTSALWRKLSRWCFKNMGGVLIVEAEKRLYAEVPEVAEERASVFRPAPVTSLNRNSAKT